MTVYIYAHTQTDRETDRFYFYRNLFYLFEHQLKNVDINYAKS